MIIGQRYGKLVVVEYRPARKKDVLCRCDCGKEVDRILEHLEETQCRGNVSMCRNCSTKLRSARNKMRHDYLVRMFHRTGSLYAVASLDDADLPVSCPEENLSTTIAASAQGQNSTKDALMTRKEIGEVLGVSRERARQLENRAMKKLRKYLLPKLAD